MSAFTLEIATPERLLLREPVTEAQIPALAGEIGVRAEHAPLITQLGIGVLHYVVDGRSKSLAVSGGVVEVLPERVRVLADVAEAADEIDAKRAHEAERRANERLLHPELGVDVGRALNSLRRAQARLRATGEG
jgi:F-type H+-transporting ATPase subunit epsilon